MFLIISKINAETSNVKSKSETVLLLHARGGASYENHDSLHWCVQIHLILSGFINTETYYNGYYNGLCLFWCIFKQKDVLWGILKLLSS